MTTLQETIDITAIPVMSDEDRAKLAGAAPSTVETIKEARFNAVMSHDKVSFLAKRALDHETAVEGDPDFIG